MPTPTSYRDLDVWQKSMKLAVAIYALTADFPKHELYGLRAQMRRAAVSIPANIAEGRGRFTRNEFAHHAAIPRGSLMELDTFLEIAVQLQYLRAQSVQPVQQMAAEIGSMLTMLIRSLRRPRANPE